MQTSPTQAGLNLAQVLTEHQRVAKANMPDQHGTDLSDDPIAAALKQMHDSVANEALPDDFIRLLDAIDSKIAEKKASH